MIDFSQYFEYVWRAGEVEGGDVSIEWVVCVVCVLCVVRATEFEPSSLGVQCAHH